MNTTDRCVAGSVLVAVIDSGWGDATGDVRVLPGVGLVGQADEFRVVDNGQVVDRIGHGTDCTRLILGAAERATILPVRVFGERLETTVPHVCKAIMTAVERGADIINLSLATQSEEDVYRLYHACAAATEAGVIVVAAAGNRHSRYYPAMFENVIGVRGKPMFRWSDYSYAPGDAVECTAHGGPPNRPAPWHLSRSASLATARIVGQLANASGTVGKMNVSAAREWLERHATRT